MIPVNIPDLSGNEDKYLQKCIKTGWISSEGPFVRQFESTFAELVSRRFGVATCNGTAALEMAVAALDIADGDEVIIPSLTIISCASAIVRAGAVPVVVDADPVTWNMNVEQLEKKITSKTRAIMVVHIYGLPVDMDPVIELAEKNGLKIIEDAAEAHGQTYKGKPCGSFGDISIFSFYPNKLVTTGEGGLALTDNKKLADRLRSLRNLCFQAKKRFVHEELGWNFRMSNLQAAVGVAQLERLNHFIAKKRRIGSRYTEALKNIESIQLPLTKTDYAVNIYWVYGIVLKEDAPFDAIEVMEQLAKHKISTRPFFWPIHKQPVFRKMGLFRDISCPISERLARRGFYIPSGLGLTENQLTQVAEITKSILQG